jgi:hypothetical protein
MSTLSETFDAIIEFIEQLFELIAAFIERLDGIGGEEE